jgi:alpha-tubulin suppressor-like RCC1 family protein
MSTNQKTQKSLDKKKSKIVKEAFSVVSKDNNIFQYSPFKENDILSVIYNSFCITVLLRNGTCISWGLNRSTLGRRCHDADIDSFLPYPIKFPTKIVDIACGRSHCLARGANFKTYSWGLNNYGQLGLSGFPMTLGSEKDEPVEIQTFSNIRIKQIFASGNSSFALSDGGNNVYGWGDNRNGQLGLNYMRSEKVQVPKLIEFTEKVLNEIVVLQTKDGFKTFLAELYRPASNVSQSIMYFNNKQLHHKEIELSQEKEKLDLQEEGMRKRKGIFNTSNVNFKFNLG